VAVLDRNAEGVAQVADAISLERGIAYGRALELAPQLRTREDVIELQKSLAVTQKP
jgi:hypothetical protein